MSAAACVFPPFSLCPRPFVCRAGQEPRRRGWRGRCGGPGAPEGGRGFQYSGSGSSTDSPAVPRDPALRRGREGAELPSGESSRGLMGRLCQSQSWVCWKIQVLGSAGWEQERGVGRWRGACVGVVGNGGIWGGCGMWDEHQPSPPSEVGCAGEGT